jgi:hypothetical protein
MRQYIFIILFDIFQVISSFSILPFSKITVKCNPILNKLHLPISIVYHGNPHTKNLMAYITYDELNGQNTTQTDDESIDNVSKSDDSGSVNEMLNSTALSMMKSLVLSSQQETDAFRGIIADIQRRWPHYKSDWTDGLRKKSIAAIVFLYFACLSPVVAFGGLLNIITEGNVGVIEFILSAGISGLLFCIIS